MSATVNWRHFSEDSGHHQPSSETAAR